MSKRPVGGRVISLDLNVLLELCILTAIKIELRSVSRLLKIDNLAMVVLSHENQNVNFKSGLLLNRDHRMML